MAKETRTFVGETGTQAFDGWAGLRIGQAYTFEVTSQGNGDVDLTFEYLGRERDMTLTAEQWAKWFKP